MVEEGKPAPTFTLPSDSGDDASLESFRGQPIVQFCPKDDRVRVIEYLDDLNGL